MMTPAQCLDVLQQFQTRFVRESRFPEQFLVSLTALFDTGGMIIKSARLCQQCRGFGLTKWGPCATCGVLGYVVKYKLKPNVRNSGRKG